MLFDYTINWLDRDFPQQRKITRRYLDTETFVRISLTGLDHFFNSGLKLRGILTLIFTAGMFFACKEDQLKKLIHMKQESRPTS